MENKKNYTAPQMEILVFTCADGTSLNDGVLGPSGVEDPTNGN